MAKRIRARIRGKNNNVESNEVYRCALTIWVGTICSLGSLALDGGTLPHPPSVSVLTLPQGLGE